MHPNEKVVHRFYEAFQRQDGAAMAACYAADATFRDPVFDLRGAQVGAMWRMLCAGATDLEVTFHGVLADDNAGSAHWEARYTFSRSGRRVHNVITANFEFGGGKILAHVDSFGFWRWSRQALGPTGWLLGWTPMVKRKVQREAMARLEKFMAESTGKPKAAPTTKKSKAPAKKKR